MSFSKRRFRLSKSKTLVLLVFTAISMQACLKDLPIDPLDPQADIDLGFKPSVAAPVAYGTITLKELLLSQNFDSANVVEDPDKALRIVYQEKLLSQSGGQSYNVPDQHDTTDVKLGAAFRQALDLAPPGAHLAPAPTKDFTEIEIDPANPSTKVDSLQIRSGQIDLIITTTLREDITVTIQVLSLKKNGVSFQYTADLNYSTSADTSSATYFKQSKLGLDISGYILDAVNGNPDTLRGIKSIITMDITKVKNTRPADYLNVDFKMAGLTFRTIWGTFPGVDIPVPSDSIIIDAFANTPYKGNISLLDPKVSILTHNSFGIPMKLKFKQFDAKLADGTNKDMIADTSVGGPFPHGEVYLARPTVVGQYADGDITFDKDNSNFPAIISGFPQRLRYDIKPLISDTAGFIVDTSKIDIAVRAEVPLDLSITNLSYSDTIAFPHQEGMDRAEEGNVRFISTNTFPFGLNIQVYFVDTLTNTTIDSLFTSGSVLLQAPPVGQDGLVVQSGVQPYVKNILVGQTKLKAMAQANQMIVKGTINTSANPPRNGVKFTTDAKLDFQLGILLKNISLIQKK